MAAEPAHTHRARCAASAERALKAEQVGVTGRPRRQPRVRAVGTCRSVHRHRRGFATTEGRPVARSSLMAVVRLLGGMTFSLGLILVVVPAPSSSRATTSSSWRGPADRRLDAAASAQLGHQAHRRDSYRRACDAASTDADIVRVRRRYVGVQAESSDREGRPGEGGGTRATGTIPTRAGRLLVGISGGGYGAMLTRCTTRACTPSSSRGAATSTRPTPPALRSPGLRRRPTTGRA